MRGESSRPGADAIECNIYFIPTDMDVSSLEIENVYLDILRAVKLAVHIPVAVKISPFFSNMRTWRNDLMPRARTGWSCSTVSISPTSIWITW